MIKDIFKALIKAILLIAIPFCVFGIGILMMIWFKPILSIIIFVIFFIILFTILFYGVE